MKHNNQGSITRPHTHCACGQIEVREGPDKHITMFCHYGAHEACGLGAISLASYYSICVKCIQTILQVAWREKCG